MPTFDYVVNNASAIARVTVLEGRDRDLSETFRIDRVLKGRLPTTVVLEPARSSLCGDTVSFYVGAGEENVGESAILALDVQFFDQVIHPVWGVIEGRLGGSAGLPDGVSTLPELERAIAAAVTSLPATDVDSIAEEDAESPLSGDAASCSDGGSPWCTGLVPTDETCQGLMLAIDSLG